MLLRSMALMVWLGGGAGGGALELGLKDVVEGEGRWDFV